MTTPEEKDHNLTETISDWNNKFTLSAERSHFNVCTWEQEKIVYLRLFGGIIYPFELCPKCFTTVL